jgi:hypothetical protein
MSRAAAMIAAALRSGPRVAPSRHDPWHGTRAQGSMWTAEQLATLERLNLDPVRVKRCQVPLQVETRANWTMPPDTVRILCPELARTRDKKRVKIITPAGDLAWVQA